jgi:hypothetical protein
MQSVCGSAGWQPGAGGCQPSHPHLNILQQEKNRIYLAGSSAMPLSAR